MDFMRKSICLLPGLLFLNCLTFVWEKNAHLFLMREVLYSSVTAIFLSFLAYVILIVFSKIIVKLLPSYCKYVFYLVVSIICGLILNVFLLKLTFSPYHHIIMWIGMIMIFSFLIIKCEKVLIVFLGVMLSFSLYNFASNLYGNAVINSKVMDEWSRIAPYNGKIKFKTTPNIYLLWQESYQSKSIIQKFYGYDNGNFIDYLNNNNFFVYENSFSSYPSTLMAMSDCYTIGLYKLGELARGNSDSAMLVRDIIGGNNLNFVYKTVKENGYDVSFTVHYAPGYYLKKKYENLDYAGLSENSFWRNFKPIIMGTKYYTLFSKDSLMDFLLKYIHNDGPQFIILKGGLGHTGADYSYDEKEKWVQSNYYQKLLKVSNQENQNIIDYIIENDNNSIIILIGDHGTHLTRGLSLKENGIYNTKNEKVSMYSLSDYIDDKYNVLLAVRMPNGEKYDISRGYYMNNANLFSFIFSYLAEDEGILKLKDNSSTIEKGLVLVKDGKKNIWSDF